MTDASMPLIELRSVSRWYGDVIGLNDVSISVPRGVIGLLGPNGAGKSTFLKLITGQIRPHHGGVLVLGEDPWNNHALMSRFGYCPENEALYGFLSGYDFLMTLGGIHGLPRPLVHERAMDWLKRVDLMDALHRPISTYSKGMKQRVKIAQAMLADPSILILDEPLNGADPIGRRLIIDLVKELGRQGKDIIVSSHILWEVQSMTDMVMLIHHGRVIAAGQIQELRGALNEYPHRIAISCEPARTLAAAVIGKPYIEGVELDAQAGKVKLFTHRPAQLYADLPQLIVDHGVRVSEIESDDDSLQAVFEYLMRTA